MELSVAICTFNGAKYIQEQLQSILNQDLQVHEIIVCDDGSTDETLEIVRNVAARYKDVSWNILNNPIGLGVTKNFERAIKLCSGDVVFLSDQDDVWYKNKTKVVVDFLNNHPQIDIVFTDADIVDENGNRLTNRSLLDAWSLLPNISLWNSGLKFEIMNMDNRVTGATIAFKKKCSERFLPFEEDARYLHDYQIALFGCAFNKIELIRERLMAYRQHGTNVMGISHNNWIYTGRSFRKLFPEVIEPIPIKQVCLRYKSPRLEFYKHRLRNYDSLIGKLRLILSLPKYIRYYSRIGFIIFFSDFLYGISNTLRDKFLTSKYIVECTNH